MVWNTHIKTKLSVGFGNRCMSDQSIWPVISGKSLEKKIKWATEDSNNQTSHQNQEILPVANLFESPFWDFSQESCYLK